MQIKDNILNKIQAIIVLVFAQKTFELGFNHQDFLDLMQGKINLKKLTQWVLNGLPITQQPDHVAFEQIVIHLIVPLREWLHFIYALFLFSNKKIKENCLVLSTLLSLINDYDTPRTFGYNDYTYEEHLAILNQILF